MGSIVGSLLGSNSGSSFTAGAAPIQNTVAPGQIDSAAQTTNNNLVQQQNLLNALNQQNGIGNQSQVYNQLQGVVNGTGPNPAQAMLANSTGQNISAQNALMAGQRGSNANTGLIARQAAQQGANTQQQAVGQGAALQANQSLNALGQASGVAGQQVANQIAGTNSNTQAGLTNQNQLLGATGQLNNANVANTSNMNNANATIANTVAKTQAGLLGGALDSLGATTSLAEGGKVRDLPQMAMGGAPAPSPTMPNGPMSSLGRFVSGSSMPQMAKGGKVPALVSPGEKYLDPKAVEQVKKGADPMKVGEHIPGKAKVKGAKNSYANDTVPKTLDEGGIVLPRSVTQSKNPHWAAHQFVSKLMAEGGLVEHPLAKRPKKKAKK